MPASRETPNWRETLAASVTSAKELAQSMPVDADAVRAVIRRYPMRINPYFLSVIKAAGAPLWRQAVPDAAELEPDDSLAPDPLREEPQSPVPHLIHRYPDRVVFMISSRCAVYCRYCMRKRRLGRRRRVEDADISRGIAYIRENPEIREVILSGGDPLLVSDERLERICGLLKGIPHVELLRIHSRAPCTLPSRISRDLALLLSSFHPLYLNIQFNHPAELTKEAVAACTRLADAGIPLGSQSVLLKGVNDDARVMASLMLKLFKNRIRPYYLHHADPVEGTRHFRTSIETGLSIMRHLRGRISGMAVPDYMIDLPGGGGKIPLLPDYVAGTGKDRLYVRNYKGEKYTYPASSRD
ncbi:MAG: KamA family radical SAM protein [Desulfosalsimonadaceae bacterium]